MKDPTPGFAIPLDDLRPTDVPGGLSQQVPPSHLTSEGAESGDVLAWDSVKWTPTGIGVGGAVIEVEENGSSVVLAPTAINFLTGFDVANVAGVATVDIDETELTGIPQGSVTNLVTDLAALAPKVRTPEDFGAIGDGVTDDSAALQSWLDSGYVLVCRPDKTYLLSDVLTVASTCDVDFGGCTIQAADSSTSGIVVTGDDVTFRNLVFDGNLSGTSVVSQGIEWQGANGRCFDVESSSHNDCEGGFSLVTGTPELTCVNCSAHLNGDRAVDDSPATLRVTSYGSTAYGVDGFSCNAGKLVLQNCYANHNSRCGVFVGKDAGEDCYLDVETKGNMSGLIRSSGDHTNHADHTYNGTTGVVTVRSNVGVIKRCVMDGRDENGDDAARYGLVVGPNGGTGPLGEQWKIGYVSGSNFEWQDIPLGSAADVMHLRGGHYNEVDTLYCNNVTGYGLVIGGGANNVSFDNAIPADHHIGTIYARYVRNPPLVCSVGRRISVGTIAAFGSAPCSIGEGSASVIETVSVDRVVYFGGTTGVFVNGGMDESTGTMENVNIGTIECFDCNLDDVSATPPVYQTALVALYGQTHIDRVFTRSKSGEPLPDYIVSVDDTPIDGTPYAHTVNEIESVDYNTAKTLVGGSSTIVNGVENAGVRAVTPGATATVTIAHGLAEAPSGYNVTPHNANAAAALTPLFYVTADATNLTLHFNANLTAATTYDWAWTARV